MDQEKVGKFMAELRRERGMTQEDLGERLGVTNKTVSRWETGRYMPDVDKLLELSGLLGVSVNELLSGERLKDRETLIKKADENLTQALRSSGSFGLADRVAYFRHKWLTEHKFDIALTLFLYLAAVIALGIWAKPLLPVGCAALGIGAYLFILCAAGRWPMWRRERLTGEGRDTPRNAVGQSSNVGRQERRPLRRKRGGFVERAGLEPAPTR